MLRYKQYIKGYGHCFLLAPVFMVLEATGEFILPYISANIINKGAATGDLPYMLKNGLYMLLLALFMLITGVLGANFAIRGASNLAADIRKNAFLKIQKFSFADIDAFTTGSLITRITNDVTQIQGFTQSLLRGVFRSPVMLIGALVMSFSLNPRLAKIFIAVVPFLSLVMFFVIRTCNPRYTKMQQQIDCLNTEIGETVTNERVIKSFVREQYQQQKFAKTNAKLAERTVSALKIMIIMMPLYGIIINITMLAVVWFSGKLINVGGMELGTLTAFITYLTQVLTALNFVANIILQGTRAAASSRRIAEVLDAEPSLNDNSAAFPNREISRGDVEFKNVSFKYFKNNKENVLSNISFKINGGETVGVIGSTGAGKTTLVSLISRLYDVDSGEVLIDGVNVKDYSLENLRKHIAVVLQQNTLFSGSIAENLRWGDENADDKALRKAAEIACADGFISSFKDGYNTELSEGGKNLSGGQKQRICIARALLKKPKILILDDSTSAVDTATDAAIRKALKEEQSGITTFVIAQRINTVACADRIIVLDKGELVGVGTHEQLLNTCSAYKEIYLSQKGLTEGGALQ